MASLRKIVKTLIPIGLFKKIEPYGHLGEAVLMNVRYGFPSKKLRIIGVTGTNGKTTTSFMIQKLLHESGIKAGILTTVANGIGDNIIPQTEHITTAQAGKLQKKLQQALEAEGLKVLTPEVAELAKGGGYIRCTTLTID